MGLLLRRHLHQKDQVVSRRQYCRLPLLSFPLAMSPFLKDRLNAERPTPVKNIFLPIARNQNVRHQLKVNLLGDQSVLELLESKPRNFWNPRSIRLLSCCSLH